MAINALPNYEIFDIITEKSEVHSQGKRFQEWIEGLEDIFCACDIKDQKRQRAMLKVFLSKSAKRILKSLNNNGDGESENPYKDAKEALYRYFFPKLNTDSEIFQFRMMEQDTSESLDSFAARLKDKAQYCEFTDVDKEVKTQIIHKCTSRKLRLYALEKGNLTLEDLLNKGRSLETSSINASVMENHHNRKPEEDLSLQRLNINDRHRNNDRHSHNDRYHHAGSNRYSGNDRYDSRNKNLSCYFCGGSYPHKSVCPAKGKFCDFCGKKDHFASVCHMRSNEQGQNLPRHKPKAGKGNKKSAAHFVAGQNADKESDSDSEASVYRISVDNVGTKDPTVHLSVNNNESMPFCVDSGARVNIIDSVTFKKLDDKPDLLPSNLKIFPYASKYPLDILGKFKGVVTHGDQHSYATFNVVNCNSGNLLSMKTSEDLGLLKMNLNAVNTESNSHVSDSLCKDFPHLFEGVGKLNNMQVHLSIDHSVKPVNQKHRRIPYQLRKKVEEQLLNDEANDIIEKVDGATPWVSPVVIVPKPNDPSEIRLCIDMREPNRAIQRERHITPTIDDVINQVNGSKVFSKLDLNSAYNQLELDIESRNITTFTTHLGLRRYKRLNFGVNSASEIFQNILTNVLSDIPNCFNINDDILVHGPTQEEHDIALKAVFKRLSDRGLTLKRGKCLFNQAQLLFYGYIFSAEGIRPNPQRVDCVKNLAAPKSVSEIRSFLGMCNHLSRFIPAYSDFSKPLRALTKKYSSFKWNMEHQNAFDALKDILSSDTTLSYYEPNRKTVIHVDASPYGLSGILTQKDRNGNEHLISFASRALSPVENRYSQVERECLAAVWSLEHYRLYTFGCEIEIITDHKPLLPFFNNPRAKLPARIEKWMLRIQQYDVKLIYKPGKDNPADYISRHPRHSNGMSHHSKSAEVYVNFVRSQSTPIAMSTDHVAVESSKDPTLQRLCKTIQSGTWRNILNSNDPNIDNNALKSFKAISSELSVSYINKDLFVILRGTRLIIPKTLQLRAVNLAHEGHQGIVKTKQLLRTKVWFPGIDKAVEKIVSECLPCLSTVVHSSNHAPLNMTELPNSPWSQVSTDFLGPYPSGEMLLVVIDDYSRYPVVEFVRSTSAEAVIPKFESIFSAFGTPVCVKSDNGSPFNSHDFKSFAKHNGFKHRKVTPLWPKANGEAERFMKTLNKTIRASVVEGNNWKHTLFDFLRNYRATPHSTTGTSPFELLFNRKPQIKLPDFDSGVPHSNEISLKDKSRKAQMKEYADRANHAKIISLKVGDLVLVRQKKINKLTPPFEPHPREVTRVNGTLISAKRRDGHIITRNVSFFKNIPNTVCDQFRADPESDIDIDTDTEPEPPLPNDPGPPIERERGHSHRYNFRTGIPAPSRYR